ncbi:MAG: SHOCT domain-containing protein [Clostridia bacterium]|jgi:hypothetical protein|nr:DUF4429 domain-containing protein [Clostridia bacterium]
MENFVYFLKGASGDQLFVYEDKIVIKHKGIMNFIAMGIKGEKTIYYSDITSIQVKPRGVFVGYIQFSLSGGNESIKGLYDAMRDENTVKISSNTQLQIVINYINERLKDQKTKTKTEIGNNNKTQIFDEIKNYKKLADEGVITQEDFNLKKKKLLGL